MGTAQCRPGRERGRDRGALPCPVGVFVRVCVAMLGDRDSAIDAVQEGFAAAIKQRASFRGEGTVDAWVWGVVLNAARNHRRARAGQDAHSVHGVLDRFTSRPGPIDSVVGNALKEDRRHWPSLGGGRAPTGSVTTVSHPAAPTYDWALLQSVVIDVDGRPAMDGFHHPFAYAADVELKPQRHNRRKVWVPFRDSPFVFRRARGSSPDRRLIAEQHRPSTAGLRRPATRGCRDIAPDRFPSGSYSA